MSDNLLEYNAFDTVDIKVKRGCSIDIELTFYDDAGDEEDLTGWTWRWMVKDAVGGDTWLDLYSPSNGITITALDGLVQIAATPTETREMAGKRGKHDLLGRNSGGTEIICPFEGDITIDDVISDEPPS